MLSSRRCEVWLWRQQRDAPLLAVFAPRALVELPGVGDPPCLEIYRSYGWMAQGARVTPLVSDLVGVSGPPTTPFHRRLEQSGSSGRVLSELWTGLLLGHHLLARRTTTLDAFVEAGATLVVRALEMTSAWSGLEEDTPRELLLALQRRTRLVATARTADACATPTIELFDAGPFRQGRWR